MRLHLVSLAVLSLIVASPALAARARVKAVGQPLRPDSADLTVEEQVHAHLAGGKLGNRTGFAWGDGLADDAAGGRKLNDKTGKGLLRAHVYIPGPAGEKTSIANVLIDLQGGPPGGTVRSVAYDPSRNLARRWKPRPAPVENDPPAPLAVKDGAAEDDGHLSEAASARVQAAFHVLDAAVTARRDVATPVVTEEPAPVDPEARRLVDHRVLFEQGPKALRARLEAEPMGVLTEADVPQNVRLPGHLRAGLQARRDRERAAQADFDEANARFEARRALRPGFWAGVSRGIRAAIDRATLALGGGAGPGGGWAPM